MLYCVITAIINVDYNYVYNIKGIGYIFYIYTYYRLLTDRFICQKMISAHTV